MKIGFIGGGNMAEALIKGFLLTGGSSEEIFVSEPLVERVKYLRGAYSIKFAESNPQLVESVDVVILAVKPQILGEVLDGVQNVEGLADKTIVSVAAGISLDFLASKLKVNKIVRVMPNTPALVLEGMSVLSVAPNFNGDIENIKKIFTKIGKVLVLEEKWMDIVTALSGSGPAFFAYIVDAMTEAASKQGMDRETAADLLLQTMKGAAILLASDSIESPKQLIKMVASPGGTTQAGLNVLYGANTSETLERTVFAAFQRSIELSKNS